jgi:hypothetical protein
MGKSVGWAPPQQLRKATCDQSADVSHQALARASHGTAAAMRARITGPPSRIRRTRHGERRMSAPDICGEPKMADHSFPDGEAGGRKWEG